MGRRRQFFGRKNDDKTLKEAIAFQPQSVVADILDKGLYNVWWNMPKVQLLGQMHDAILIQYEESREAEIIPKVTQQLVVPVQVGDYTMEIPSEAEVGWNWGAADKKGKNPDGLIEYKGEDNRTRQYQPTHTLLDAQL